jgi:hypothetical protein
MGLGRWIESLGLKSQTFYVRFTILLPTFGRADEFDGKDRDVCFKAGTEKKRGGNP